MAAPRFGFSYDPFRRGRTEIRSRGWLIPRRIQGNAGTEVIAAQFSHAIALRYESRYGRRPLVFRAIASAGAGSL